MLSMYKKNKIMLNSILSAIFYLISSVFFILALKRFIITKESSRRGNIFGMMGMAIAGLH